MKKLLSLLIAGSLAFACVDDELGSPGDLTGAKIVGFESNFATVEHFEDIGVVQREFAVNLIGLGNGQVSNEPITVNYVIDTEASTATEGVEFDFVDSSGSIVIPAGSTFGMFPLNINTGNFNPTEKTELVLKLSGASDGTVVGEQFDTLSIVFVGCQSTLGTAAGTTYTSVVTNNISGLQRTFTNDVVKLIDVNRFNTDYTGTWLAGQLAPATDQGFNFIDICGEITVPSQYLANYWGNIVRGLPENNGVDGHVIDENSFTITYEISFAAGNQNYTAVYTRNN